MRILLDECLPRELADELVGHEVRTVQQEGWSSLENGALLLRTSGTFSVFITIDKNIERTQRLPANLAVVTLRARTNRIESLRPLVSEVLRVLKDIRPGTFVRVGEYQPAAAAGGREVRGKVAGDICPPRLGGSVGRTRGDAEVSPCGCHRGIHWRGSYDIMAA